MKYSPKNNCWLQGVASGEQKTAEIHTEGGLQGVALISERGTEFTTKNG